MRCGTRAGPRPRACTVSALRAPICGHETGRRAARTWRAPRRGPSCPRLLRTEAIVAPAATASAVMASADGTREAVEEDRPAPTRTRAARTGRPGGRRRSVGASRARRLVAESRRPWCSAWRPDPRTAPVQSRVRTPSAGSRHRLEADQHRQRGGAPRDLRPWRLESIGRRGRHGRPRLEERPTRRHRAEAARWPWRESTAARGQRLEAARLVQERHTDVDDSRGQGERQANAQHAIPGRARAISDCQELWSGFKEPGDCRSCRLQTIVENFGT